MTQRHLVPVVPSLLRFDSGAERPPSKDDLPDGIRRTKPSTESATMMVQYERPNDFSEIDREVRRVLVSGKREG